MKKILMTSLGTGILLLLAPPETHCAVYYGNANTSGGGAVGNGRLSLTDNGTTVSGTFYRGTGSSFSLNLVLYIDSVSGGFTDTTQFSDSADALRTAVSGYYASGS